MWCSERFATIAANGPGSARSSSDTHSNSSPSGARRVDREHVVAEPRHRERERAMKASGARRSRRTRATGPALVEPGPLSVEETARLLRHEYSASR